MVDSVRPSISYALVQAGAGDDPYLQIQARTLAAKAIKSYDPSKGASLPTWVTQQLMQLRRMKRTSQNAIRLPEQVQLDAFQIHKATMNFMDQKGREPDILELSDAVHLSPKRIAHVRSFSTPIVAEGAFGEGGGATSVSHDEEALAYLYKDSDAVDRQILEMRMGYGGKHPTPLPKNIIGERLKLHPSQVTRRAARLAMRLNQIQQDLSEI